MVQREMRVNVKEEAVRVWAGWIGVRLERRSGRVSGKLGRMGSIEGLCGGEVCESGRLFGKGG